MRKLRQKSGLKLVTRKIQGVITFVGWSDASWANRKSGSSTGGFLIGACGQDVVNGSKGHVGVISWATNKLKRVARSSLAAEVQALSVTEDELHIVRAAWMEFTGTPLDVNNPDKTIRKVAGITVIDAKSIYDTMTSKNQALHLAEKRTAIELSAYLQNTSRNKTETRWVHGEANLADGFTKLGASQMLWDFFTTSTWSIVFDEEKVSGKKRNARGMGKLENGVPEAKSFYQMALYKIQEQFPDFAIDSEGSNSE